MGSYLSLLSTSNENQLIDGMEKGYSNSESPQPTPSQIDGLLSSSDGDDDDS